MNAIGIYGGTFDPIHLGHLITAQFVKELRGLEKIIFVPAYISPFKEEIKTTEPEHRLEMIRLSIDKKYYFEVSDFELKNKNLSYTIDTVRFFKKKYDQIELIIGLDNLFKFHKWKEPDEILKLARLIVMKRRTEEKPKSENEFYNKAVFIDTPLIEINSTEIRERITDNLPIDFLVTPEVKQYIKKFKLYKD